MKNAQQIIIALSLDINTAGHLLPSTVCTKRPCFILAIAKIRD